MEFRITFSNKENTQSLVGSRYIHHVEGEAHDPISNEIKVHKMSELDFLSTIIMDRASAIQFLADKRISWM